MTDLFRIIIVGHNLEAKCDVANALTKQRNAFKQLSCRRKFKVQRFNTQDTIAGRTYIAIVTPNLNTPAWTHSKEAINMNYTHKVFLYINDDSKIQVNHEESISKIKAEFRNTDVYEVKYSSCGEPYDGYKFRPTVDFGQQVTDIKAVLLDIGQAYAEKQNPQHRGSQVVTGRKKGEIKTVTAYPEASQPVTDVDIEVDDKPQEIPLPEKLTQLDWEKYSKTLKCGRAKSNLVRVNIVGNQSAGKTTLLKLLQKEKVQCPDETLLPTETLDIKDITTRCWESNGKKKWETNLSGYERELNVQRMADAMCNATSVVNDGSDEEAKDEVLENDEYQLGSTIEEDGFEMFCNSHPYTNISTQQSLDLYLKKVIGRVNIKAVENVYVSYWDFAGQSTFYAAHQAFLSHSAVYILVVDLSLDLQRPSSDSLKFRGKHVHECSVAESISFWMSSIKAYTTDSKGGTSPIMVVGTHKDKLEPPQNCTIDEMIRTKFHEIQDILKMTDVECIAIDNTKPDPDDLQAIRDRVLELGLGVIDEKIPAQWIELERKVLEQKMDKGKYIITFDELKDLDKGNDMPMKDDDRLEAFLGHQHCRGQLIHFPHEDLKNVIILYPDVLATFLNSLMRDKEIMNRMGKGSYNRDGVINQMYIDKALDELKISEFQKMRKFLTDMLIHLNIIHGFQSHSDKVQYILPCLLPCRSKGNEMETEETKIFRIVFPNNTMPSAFFYILLSGLLKRWKLLECKDGEPELYNFYACFYLEVTTVHMEVYWSQSYITVCIKNFSRKKTWTDIDLAKIVDTFTECITNIMQVYRHIGTHHVIKVQCPKHKESFVSLQQLRVDGEAMCFSKSHSVTLEEVLNLEQCEKDKYPIIKDNPTTLHLSRLAMDLKRDDATSLAIRMRLLTGNTEADDVAIRTKDPRFRRFLILIKWKWQHHEASISDLLELITYTRDYEKKTLIQCLTLGPSKCDYDISDEKLDKIPNGDQDIIAAMECIGDSYPFLAFELGLSFEKVEELRHNCKDLKEMTYEMLMAWRQGNPNDSFPRRLLDTAKFLGINTYPIQNALKNL
ncbi:hypothetical protein ACF0H5_018745 [Mactra antiquata]